MQIKFNPLKKKKKSIARIKFVIFASTVSLNGKNHLFKFGVFDFGLSPLDAPMVDWGPV